MPKSIKVNVGFGGTVTNPTVKQALKQEKVQEQLKIN